MELIRKQYEDEIEKRQKKYEDEMEKGIIVVTY